MWGDIAFPKDIWNDEKVLRLFNSELGPDPRGKRATYREFVDLLQSGEVTAECFAITCRPRPVSPAKGEKQSEDWQVFRRCKRGGGDLHGWLKWWAYNWMAEQSETPASFEVTFKGYGRVDLYSEQLSSFVECGNTSPTHALHALRNEQCSRFIVLPFQRAAIENTGQSCSRKLEAFSFQLTEKALRP